MRGQFSRLIFLDSSVNTIGDRAKVLLPARSFSVQGHERMSLTLQSFGIRRNWYNINPTNNTGYVGVTPAAGGETLFEFRIPPGSYSTFAQLAAAIEFALTEAVNRIADIDSVECTYGETSRLFQVTFTKAVSTTAVQLKCFAIKGPPPDGVSLQGGFSDLHEILGGVPIRSALDAAGNSLKLVGGTAPNVTQLSSRFPASLNTLDAIYIHLPGLETINYNGSATWRR